MPTISGVRMPALFRPGFQLFAPQLCLFQLPFFGKVKAGLGLFRDYIGLETYPGGIILCPSAGDGG